MINAGKAYLKALHGAAAASKLYVDAITKLARQAQQGTWGGSSDIGNALMQVVEVYKEIQAQQMTILKAFYVDLLVPLETNLEKDTKVVQSEQKKFLQQHKSRSESYSKAAANMKKQRKKGTKGAKAGVALDKELKNMQLLEEEKSKLDVFCEQSLKNAMTQERRRYGFVLERHCSLAKHYLAYHTAGSMAYGRTLEEWQEIAKSREYLPENVENMFTTKLRAVSFWRDDDLSGDEDRISLASQLRKTKSMDASCLDIRSINDAPSPMKPLSRAKSEFNLNSSSLSLAHDEVSSPHPRPKSMAIPDKSSWDSPLARALYAYLSSGENQLSFLEGDVIALLGERTKGWQFGENLRTQCSGWFPLAYTELIMDDSSICSPTPRRVDSAASTATTPGYGPGSSTSGKPSPTTMFGDTLAHRRAASQTHHRVVVSTCASAGPPPTHTAPTPAPAGGTIGGKRAPPLPPLPPLPLHLAGRRGGGKPGSLHSSNDSGFSNDPPPQPEADYSDDETVRKGPQPTGKELVSSVRGWLLYKSAMDLWEDVTTPEQQQQKQNTPHHATISRTKSAPKTGTLGRYNSQDLLQPTPVAIEPRPVKRTKSLWRFRHKKSEVLEGMALWKHRSLIDVNEPPKPEQQKDIDVEPEVDEEEDEKENIYSSAEDVKEDDVESVIVVEDHVTKDSLLPRTKLIKSLSHGVDGARDPKKKDFQTWNPVRAKEALRWGKEEGGTVKYGPWYDLWGLDASVKS